jgi:hypothetical protein
MPEHQSILDSYWRDMSSEIIEIEVEGKGKALAELDGRNPSIVEAFCRILPLEALASLWGEEVYFNLPLVVKDENPSPHAARGDVSYWSPGPAFCIFFGLTQPYSPVNHLGKVIEGVELFEEVKEGDRILLKRLYIKIGLGYLKRD